MSAVFGEIRRFRISLALYTRFLPYVQASAEGSLYTSVSEALGSIRAVKSFTMEDMEQERFETRARTSQEAYVRVMTLSSVGGLVAEAVAGLGTAANGSSGGGDG